MALILSRADLQKLNPPMSGAVAVIEKCCRIQASGDVTNHPRVHLAYPPTSETGKLAAIEARSHELHDAVTGKVQGRASDDEIITCLVPASSLWDPAFARWAYDLAREKELGTEIKF